MPHIFEWFLGGLLLLLGVLGASSTVEPLPPSGVSAPGVKTRVTHSTLPMLDLLVNVPDTPETRTWLAAGDADAWFTETGITRPLSLDDVRAMAEEEYLAWLHKLPSETSPPAAFSLQNLITEEMRDTVGFSYFDALHWVETANPPDTITIVNVRATPAQIANALLAYGYEGTRAEGAMLYVINDDYAIDVANPVPAMRLGTYNRVAVLDASPDAETTTVLVSKATAPIEAALAAGVGRASLSSDPYYGALVAALEENSPAVPGQLVGVIFRGEMPLLSPDVLLGSTPEEAKAVITERMATLEEYPLAPWLVSALATHREGEDVYLSAVVAFPPGVDPEVNADSLAFRMADYESATTGLPFADAWDPYQYDWMTIDGVPIAWVTLKLEPDAVGGLTWLRMIAQRDDLFLVPAGAP